MPFVILAEAESDKPNILFILTDDQRWDALGCYGNDSIRTPNLDKLAAKGARLDAFYAAAPLCCPSRANYLTGYYGHQTGILTNRGERKIPQGIKGIAHYMKDAGYTTAFVGKAHLRGLPATWGFHYFPVVLNDAQTTHEKPNVNYYNYPEPKEGNVTTIFVDAAIDFIRKNQKKTWFLWLATTAPHIPYIEDPKYQYDLGKLKEPPGWPVAFPFDKAKFAAYYATISMLDEQIGRVLNEIDSLGLSGKTFIIMASDNGHMFRSHKVHDKDSWYEGSSRVPAIVRWPGRVPEGIKVKHLLSSIDFVPTLLKVAGISRPSTLEGVDFLPALSENKAVRTMVFSESLNWQMVRKDSWKYVQEGRNQYLYNLEVDPFEMNNLATKSEKTQIVYTLKKSISDWLTRTTPLRETPPPDKKKKKENRNKKKQSSNTT